MLAIIDLDRINLKIGFHNQVTFSNLTRKSYWEADNPRVSSQASLPYEVILEWFIGPR